MEEFELLKIKEDEILAKVVSDSCVCHRTKLLRRLLDHKRILVDIADNPIIIGNEFAGELVKWVLSGLINSVWAISFRYSRPCITRMALWCIKCTRL